MQAVTEKMEWLDRSLRVPMQQANTSFWG